MQHSQFWTIILVSFAIIFDTITVKGSPLDFLLDEYLGSAGEDASDTDDYDIHYDQRQSGTENYRLKVDGVVIAAPAGSEDAIGSFGLLASNYVAKIAAATSEHDDGVDDGKPYEYDSSNHKDPKDEVAAAHHQPETGLKLNDLDSWQFKNGPQSPVINSPTDPETPSPPLVTGERLQLRSKSGGATKKRNK